MNVTPTMVAVVTSVPTHKDPSCVAADQDMNLLQMLAIVSVRNTASCTVFPWVSMHGCLKFSAKQWGRAPHQSRIITIYVVGTYSGNYGTWLPHFSHYEVCIKDAFHVPV